MPFEIFALPALICLVLGVWRGVKASKEVSAPPKPAPRRY